MCAAIVGGVRELLGEYIRTVKGGTIEPHSWTS